MNQSNQHQFATEWSAMSDVLRGSDPTPEGIRMAYELLKPYDMPVVIHAMKEFMQKNKFFPAPSEIIEIIEGRPPTPEEIAGHAIALTRGAPSLIGCQAIATLAHYAGKKVSDCSTYELIKAAEVAMPEMRSWLLTMKRGDYEKLSPRFKELANRFNLPLDGELCETIPAPKRAPKLESVK